MTGDQPPHDLAAERSVLGACMLDQGAVAAVAEVLASRDFYQPIHETIWDAILAIHGQGIRPDPVTVADELTRRGSLERVGGPAYLHTLMQAPPTTANVEHYAGIVRHRAVLRRLAAAGLRIVQSAQAPDGGDLTEIVAAAMAEMSTIGQAPRTSTLHEYMIDGASFVLDAPETIPVLWGQGEDVLWAKGEALMIAGGNGVGKTTIAAQLVRARLGLQRFVIGFPVAPTEQRVLYLAMDRPDQCRRAMGRLFKPGDRDVLAERLTVWKGPPPLDLAKNTDVMLEMCQDAKADTVIVDSLKDAAIGLSEDEVGAGYNRARQKCLAADVEVMELHHNVKRGPNGAAPTSISDVYGSAWLTSGAGSVIGLHGEPGDMVVQLRHLKQPMADVGPLTLVHDHATGVTQVERGVDLLDLVRRLGSITAQAGAGATYQTDKPTPNQVEKIRRKLDRLTNDGFLTKSVTLPGKPTLYVVSGGHGGHARGHAPLIEVPGHAGHAGVTREDKTAGHGGHAKGHGGHGQGGHAFTPP